MGRLGRSAYGRAVAERNRLAYGGYQLKQRATLRAAQGVASVND